MQELAGGDVAEGVIDCYPKPVNRARIHLRVDKAELEKRRKAWKQPKPNITEGYMARYAKLVTGAASGGIFKTDDI